MRIIPILFSTPMVQAILSDNKSMTRRTMKLQPGEGERYEAMGENEFAYISKGGISGPYKCPYGQPGDVLWVRESFCITHPFAPETNHFGYKCGVQPYSYEPASEKYDFSRSDRWKPNIHMPFEACRFFLRVKEIRVERLHDITQKDAICEGIIRANNLHFDVPASITIWKDYTSEGNYFQREDYSFRSLWISINGADSWNSNPWVWVNAFERITDGNEIAAIRKQWNDKKSLKTK